LVEGTHRKDREAKNPPKPERGTLSPPRWLNRAAKLEWRRVVKWLDKMAMASDFDRAVLATYCQAYSRLQEFEKAVQEFGITFVTDKGYVCQRPEVSLAQKQAALVKSLAQEFGMSPSARTRVTVAPKATSKDPTEELLFGKRRGA
jgi:P27 family predicted phage terminase small subunit